MIHQPIALAKMKGKLEDKKMAAMRKNVSYDCFITVTAENCKIFQSRKFGMFWHVANKEHVTPFLL